MMKRRRFTLLTILYEMMALKIRNHADFFPRAVHRSISCLPKRMSLPIESQDYCFFFRLAIN